MEERRHNENRRPHYGNGLAGSRRFKLGALSRNHFSRWEEVDVRSSFRDWGRWTCPSRGCEVMRRFLVTAILVLAFSVVNLFAQPGSPVPRGPDGKPDLTGVWQGGSTLRGNWEETNAGLGVGGSGKNA